VFKKPILLLPFVYIFIISTIFIFLTPAMPETGFQLDTGLILTLIGLGILEGLITLVFSAMGLAGIRMHVNGEQVTCKNQTATGLRMYWKLLLQRVLIILIVGLPAVVLYLFYNILSKINGTLGTIAGIIALIAYLVYIIFIGLAYMFSTIIVSYEGKSAVNSLKEAHSFFKQNSAHTVLVFLSLLLFALLALIVYFVLFTIVIFVIPFTYVDVISNIIISLIMIPVAAALILYLFKAYNNAGEQKVNIKTSERSESVKSTADKKQSKQKTISKKVKK
jgi:hypothetical protein